MKQFFALLLPALMLTRMAFAGPPDEGMWLPLLLKDYNYAEMQRLGLKLTPEQIYSVNTSSLKDAIVQLGGFCTAEVISMEGLILTNHHCGYDAIAESSSETNNYLRDGFWAQVRGEEIPIEGLSVSFLHQMLDVSDRIQAAVDAAESDMAEMAAAEEMAKIEEELSESGKYTVGIESMFDGNAYYAFVYQIYSDIRLVGAPPSSIGKFGGDTDNWMWPRHTGDFSMFRIYAGADNQPAEYNASNIAFVPKHALPISTRGLKEGDFTMVMGYPGSTDRYLTSYEVMNIQEVDAPVMIDILGKRLDIMKAEMAKDEAIHIQLASDYASLANSYKYYKGQLRGLNKFNFSGKQQAEEKELQAWMNETLERKNKYGTVLSDIETITKNRQALSRDNLNLNLAGFAPQFVQTAIMAWRLHRTLDQEEIDQQMVQTTSGMIREMAAEFFPEYLPEMDQKMTALALDVLKNNMSADAQASFFTSKYYLKKAKGSNDRMVALIFSKSFLTDAARLEKFLNKPTLKAMNNDPGMIYILSLIELYRSKILGPDGDMSAQLDEARKIYMQALMEKDQKNFYPNANFTMRLTYGTVQHYDSWEGAPYKSFTYADEILAKYKAGDDEFDVPERLRTLIKDKDFGIYGNSDGTMNVCFLHNTDITGGNSGSPVINANGELVGCAFDGNWESMTSDLFWQDEYVRTISVDIRYVLFIIDKFANAGHLIQEMQLVK
ncbi:MAG: hypothetical protein A3D92_16385 [Bacteroidetes bacterium RIFCSPHIGHO2_02_FULL_44_7]|nr:MAG: hypothetical protein A3D92_16385 [Bacteroidetes bacterium RIFCSPHIGHO2_02_FULL_44_7]